MMREGCTPPPRESPLLKVPIPTILANFDNELIDLLALTQEIKYLCDLNWFKIALNTNMKLRHINKMKLAQQIDLEIQCNGERAWEAQDYDQYIHAPTHAAYRPPDPREWKALSVNKDFQWRGVPENSPLGLIIKYFIWTNFSMSIPQFRYPFNYDVLTEGG